MRSFLLTFLFVFIMCNFCSCVREETHIIEAHRIVKTFTKKMLAHNLFYYSSGGAFMNKINEFILYYTYYTDVISLDEARILAVITTEELLKIVNEDVNARPYLSRFPYDENFLYYDISFEDFNCRYLKNLASVTVCLGKISYKTFSNGFDTFYTETYAEAYEKVYGVPLPDRTVQYGNRE